MHPSSLFYYASVDLIAAKNGKLSLLITYPIISRTFSFKRINIIESPNKVLLAKDISQKFVSFLVPIGIAIQDIANSIGQIRSGKHCLINKQYEACDTNNVFDYADLVCLVNIINGLDNHCPKRNVHVFDFNVLYSPKGALIFMKNKVDIVQFSDENILFQSHPNGTNCIYLRPRRGLMIKSVFRHEKLFPSSQHFEISTPNLDVLLPNVSLIKNLTIPIRKTERTFTKIVFDTANELDIWMIVAIVSCVIIGTAIIILMIYFCCFKRRSIDGSNLYASPN